MTVTVPATSANLGPGFDALGLALDHRDRLVAEVLDAPGVQIVVRGQGEGTTPRDDRHLVYRSMLAAFEQLGADVPGIALDCTNVIPHSRGLGSSSAAIVAGVCLARGLVAGGALLMDDDAVLALSAELEGHPDNVAPALLGGFTVAYRDGDRFRATGVAVDPRIRAVAFVPPDGVATALARGLLPETVTHAAAATNAGRAALLVAALSGSPELLFAATEDRLHQEYRGPAMPASLELMDALRADGLPAVISGAGPTVLVFTDRSGQPEVARRAPNGWRALVVPIDSEGVTVDLPGTDPAGC